MTYTVGCRNYMDFSLDYFCPPLILGISILEARRSYTFRVAGNKCTTHTLQQMETIKVTWVYLIDVALGWSNDLYGWLSKLYGFFAGLLLSALNIRHQHLRSSESWPRRVQFTRKRRVKWKYHPSYTFRVAGNKCTTHTWPIRLAVETIWIFRWTTFVRP
jgi:hypothetical protein